MAIVTTDNQNYSNIAEAIRSKTGGVTKYRPDQMAAAISGIQTGVSVQKKQGTLTTNSSGAFSFDVGFVPDLVIIWPDTIYTESGNSYEMQLAFDFTARKYQQYIADTVVNVPNGFYHIGNFKRNNSSVSGTMYNVSYTFERSPLGNKTLNYMDTFSGHSGLRADAQCSTCIEHL